MGEALARVKSRVLPGDGGCFVVPVPAGGAAFGVTVHSFAFVPVEAP